MGLVVAVSFYCLFLPRLVTMRGDFALTCHWVLHRGDSTDTEGDSTDTETEDMARIRKVRWSLRVHCGF